jgi:hypothetical protein
MKNNNKNILHPPHFCTWGEPFSCDSLELSKTKAGAQELFCLTPLA